MDDLDTPAVVIERRLVTANLERAQAYADAHGLRLRPHVKTHKLPALAKRQLALGAVGITCQKIGEAEVMSAAGIDDIFLPYNILGAAKLERLAALHARITLAVTADSETTVAGYAARFASGDRPLTVLIECDTGAGRCGVQSPDEAVVLARAIDAAPGLRFDGLMTYPPIGRSAEVDAWLTGALDMLRAAGLDVGHVSSGGSPELYRAADVTATTEYRPGTYVYSDRMQVSLGLGTLADCALSVLATVVSRPVPDRAILDAGSKALAADLCALPGHGHVVGYPDAVITALSEEHAIVDVSACTNRPSIGERVHVVPNHVCPVSNLFDTVHFVDGDEIVESVAVAARGRVG